MFKLVFPILAEIVTWRRILTRKARGELIYSNRLCKFKVILKEGLIEGTVEPTDDQN